MAVVALDKASKVFGGRRRWLRGEQRGAVRAVNGVSFRIERGERLGIVGESGSGKTTTVRMILGLTAATGGRIVLADRDVTALSEADLAHIRRTAQMVFQDPLSSLNPKKTVRQIVSLPLVAQRIGTPRQRLARVKELLDRVGLPQRYLNARPQQLSGGQRQRVGLARALAIEPALLVLDEPTASLDVSVQARVLELLVELQRDLGIAQIMVSHNLGVIRNAADMVAVMYLGRVVEFGSAAQIFSRPQHPYTQALFSAIPVIDESERAFLPARRELRGEVAGAGRVPAGCPFHTRCPAAMPHCATVDPATTELEPGHLVDCHLHADGGESTSPP